MQFNFVDRLELGLGNAIMDTVDFGSSLEEQRTYVLRSNTAVAETGMDTYAISGYLNNSLVFRTYRMFRFVPSHRDYLILRQGITEDWEFKFGQYAGGTSCINNQSSIQQEIRPSQGLEH